MQHCHIVEAVDRTLKDICNSNQLFGGLTVAFGGEFQQTLPAIVKKSRPQIIGACIQQSIHWASITVLTLTTNMHLNQSDQAEQNFAQWQLDVGHRNHTDAEADLILPNHFKCISNTLESLVQTIYPGITDLPHPPDQQFTKWTILSACNDDVHDINTQILKDFPGDEQGYHGADSVVTEEGEGDVRLLYPVEYLNTINASGLPLAKLTLKVGCPVMVLQNLSPGQGICNGTHGILTKMTNNVLQIRLLGGGHAKEHFFIPCITMTPSDL